MSAPVSIAKDRVLEEAVKTASPEQLIDMVMEHVLLHLSLALSEKAPWLETMTHLHKAEQGVVVLLNSLAPKTKPGLSIDGIRMVDNLEKLYVFMLSELNKCEREKNLGAVPDLMKIMGNLHDGWKNGVMNMAA